MSSCSQKQVSGGRPEQEPDKTGVHVKSEFAQSLYISNLRLYRETVEAREVARVFEERRMVNERQRGFRAGDGREVGEPCWDLTDARG